MQRVARSLRSQAGFTLVEVLAASVVLLLGIFSVVVLVDRANGVTVTTRSREAATSLARELTEAARGIPYSQVIASTLPGLLAAQPGLAPAPGATTYAVERRGFTYQVAIETCIVDESRDGGGDQSGGGFCPDSAAANTPATVNGVAAGPDRNPDDYRRVTATVSWRHGNVERTVRQSTVLNNPGSAGGPAIRELRLAPPIGNPPPQLTLFNAPDQQVQVTFKTSSRPYTTNWLLDGTVQRVKPVSTTSDGLNWSATWDFTALVDGTYVVGAEAFDRFGVSGPGRSLNIRVNRRAPDPPTGLLGGRDDVDGDRFVELEWQKNRERDIEDYVVERAAAPAGPYATLGATVRTTFQDRNAPENDTLYYRVRARDKNEAGALRNGDASAPLTATDANRAPNPVTDLTATAGAPDYGTTTLRWQRPAPHDPDADDAILFYRIYRDGRLVGDHRYDRWYDDAASVTYVDDETGGAPHLYVVRSVDSHLRESAGVEVQG